MRVCERRLTSGVNKRLSNFNTGVLLVTEASILVVTEASILVVTEASILVVPRELECTGVSATER